MLWFLFLSCLLPETVALIRTRGVLRQFFVAQAIATVVTSVADAIWTYRSDEYRVLYCLATLGVLWISCRIVRKVSNKVVFFYAILSAMGTGLYSLLKFKGTRDVDFYIMLVQATVLVFLAIGAGLRVHIERDRNLFILAILWLAMAIYDFNWLLNNRSDMFDYFAPAYLIIVASLCVLVTKQRSFLRDIRPQS